MLGELLKDYKIILASASPRRQAFFKELLLSFEIRVKPVNEVFPDSLQGAEIADYLSKLKASAFEMLEKNEILITSDTVVWHNGKALGKPESTEEAFEMIRSLSGDSHKVITSVCFTMAEKQIVINETTTVWFKKFTDAEISYYIENFRPFDKAGGYGIQEWIGTVGVEKIEGSYTNVIGLPTAHVYKTLRDIAGH